jgi:preprotein translocase subunit YajC
VITAGGFFGKVWEVLDDSYIIELADGVKARILKSSISTRREVGDEKSKQPRKLKKKRRREKPEETSAALNDESSLKVLENGVSLEENDALIDLAAEGPRKEAKTSEKKENE